MAGSPKRLCSRPGCSALVTVPERYCPTHGEADRKEKAQRDRMRGSRIERGYDNAWSRAAAGFRRKHPWCETCKQNDDLVPAQCVDHIVPHRGDMVLFWDRSNWQPLCNSCHSRKTASEDGGFGNARKA